MIEKKSDINGVRSVATFSDCERYRYILTRIWNEKGQRVLFIGLNPSTADENKNDPTVTRMINFSKNWSFGSVTVCNLFAFRATFPKDLKKEKEPIGLHNDELIKQESQKSNIVVTAWGNHGKFLNRSSEVLAYIKKPYHFGFTKLKEPKHILYLKNDSEINELDAYL